MASHPGVCVRFLAPEVRLSKHYNVVMLCEHQRVASDLTLFLTSIDLFCDQVIILDYSGGGDAEKYLNSDKLLAYLEYDGKRVPKEESTNDSYRHLMFRIASLLNVEWGFFIYSNEYFLPQFIETGRKHLEDEQTYAIAYNHILTGSPDKYYISPGSERGAWCEVRLFRLTKVGWDDIDRIGPGHIYTSPILLERRITPEDYPTYGIDMFTETLDVAGIYRDCDQKLDNYARILDGDLGALAHCTLRDLGEYFLSLKPGEIGQVGLYTGDCGSTFLLAQLYLWSKDDRYSHKLEEYWANIQEQIAMGRMGASFCSGLAGFGWLAAYLQQKGLLEIREEYWESLDRILEKQMKQMEETAQYDQMHGMLSVGLYFLKRRRSAPIEYVLEMLSRLAEYDKDEVRWVVTSNNRPPRYDFGLAHGMAGILYFLGRAFAQGVKPELCLRLGNGILAFYRNNESDPDSAGSYYPYSISCKEYRSDHYQPEQSRLAWCYGDTSVLYSIYRYAGLTGNEVWKQSAVNGLRHTVQRRDFQSTRVKDAQFCHGAASLVQIYNRLFRETGEMAFRTGMTYWLKVMLNLGRVPIKTAGSGYLFSVNNTTIGDKAPCDSLLEGSAGVAMTLIALMGEQYMDWDEAFMLS